jgi:hypothetical protein
VPISRVRIRDRPYIVFIAPNTAPIEISVTNVPNTRITVVSTRDCSA